MSKLVHNYFYNVLYQLLVFIAPIFTAPYLARVLGADLLGTVNYVITIATVFTTVGLLGMQNYAIREIAYVRSDYAKLERCFYELYFARLIIGIITVIAFIAYVDYAKYPYLMWIELMYVVAVFIDPCWFYIGMEDMGKAVARNFFAKTVNIIGIFVLVNTREDYIRYAFLLSFMTLLASLLAMIPLKNYFKLKWYPVDGKRILAHLRGSLQLFLPQIAMMLYTSVDKILLDHFVSNGAVAFYDQAEKIVKIPLTFITVLSTVMMPRLANQLSVGDRSGFQYHLSETLKFSSMLAFPMMLGIAGIASTLIPWYLGNEFIEAIPAIWVLSPIIVLCSWTGLSGDQYLVVTKQTGYLTISYVAAALVNLVMNFILIPDWGVVGAALSIVAAYTVILGIQYYIMLQQMKTLTKELWHSCFYLIKAVPMFCLVYELAVLFGPSWKVTVLQVIAGIVMYGGIMLLCKDPYAKYIANKMLTGRSLSR